jgi:hypothetical protein
LRLYGRLLTNRERRANNMRFETTNKTRGSILKQILKTPAYKDILRVNLNEMSQKTGSSLVKTLVSEDPEVFLSLISALPTCINVLTSGAGEIAVQLKNLYPPETLKSFLVSLAEDIDKETLSECSAAWSELVSSLWEASSDVRIQAKNSILASGPRVIAGAINTAARSLNALVRDDPNTLNTFVSEVFTEVDKSEIAQVTLSLAEAFLDQKWHLVSWALQLTRRRIRKRFGI